MTCRLARYSAADLFIESDDFTEIFADLVGVDVDRGDDAQPRFGEQQPRDLRADGADSVLRHCDGLNWIHEHLVSKSGGIVVDVVSGLLCCWVTRSRGLGVSGSRGV